MRTTGALDGQGEARAETGGGSGDPPLLRALRFGALVELLWGLGLVVMLGVVPAGMGLTSIVLLCVAQLVVQLVYFLHIGAKRSQRQNSAIFLCTAGLIAIIVAGSLWVMHNANTNMMPTHMSIERAKLRD